MKHTRRRGFALIIAITLIGLLGITIGTIGIAMRTDVLRTRQAVDDAQLRQLLLAGAQQARARLAGATPVDGAMTLPQEIAGDGASVQLTQESTASDQSAVRIDASVGKRQLSQVVHFAHRNDTWQVDGAELGA
jgi:type II secretory pathway component PulK